MKTRPMQWFKLDDLGALGLQYNQSLLHFWNLVVSNARIKTKRPQPFGHI